MKNDEGKVELTTILCDESHVIVDHLLEDESIENSISSRHLISQNTNIGSDQGGIFGYVVIEYFLESFKKENIQDKLTNMLHLEENEYWDHMARDELIKHSNSYDLVVDKSLSSKDDQESCLENAIIEDFFI